MLLFCAITRMGPRCMCVMAKNLAPGWSMACTYSTNQELFIFLVVETKAAILSGISTVRGDSSELKVHLKLPNLVLFFLLSYVSGDF